LKLFVVAAIIVMKPSAATSATRTPFIPAIVEGIRFIYGHSALRWIYFVLVVAALSVRSSNFLLPAYAVHVIHTDARGLGWLYAATGAGSLVGGLTVAAFNTRRRAWTWFLAALLASFGVAGLGFTDNLTIAAIVLTVVGCGMQSFVGSSNVLVQTLAPDEMRGRTISVYAMILLGLVPGGALLIGSIARFVDLRLVFIGAGIFCAAVACWTFFAHPKLRAV
jgi:hypothetical protein